jgi:hypothetical protein
MLIKFYQKLKLSGGTVLLKKTLRTKNIIVPSGFLYFLLFNFFYMTNVTMKDIVELSKARGFVYPGSEIYGGLANSWDYGPYGTLLKENLKNLWIKNFVQKRDDMVMLDSAILMNPKVWIASGHV